MQNLSPINPQFNRASLYIASRIFPLGFDVHASAPNTFPDLAEQMDRLNRMSIWSGDRSNSCFADTETWLQFRAWHDWAHYRFNCAFDMPGEHLACHVQAGQLARLYGRGEDVAQMVALLFCNIIGQLEANASGSPVKDGHAFCVANVDSWLPYARALLAEQGPTDVDALTYGAGAYELRAKVGPTIPEPACDSEVCVSAALSVAAKTNALAAKVAAQEKDESQPSLFA